MEVARRLRRGRVAPAWRGLADAVAGFLGEAAFRLWLTYNVLVGRAPIETKKRPWIRSKETPLLVDVHSWVDGRLLFSGLVWPPLESSTRDAGYHHRERLEEVLGVIAEGAADKGWSTYWEVDYGLKWDHNREVWVDGDGLHYDGSRFGAGSRRPGTTKKEERA